MPCDHFRIPQPDGGVATGILCSRGRRRKAPKCRGCGKPSTKQCDWVMEKGRRLGLTCDAYVCDDCALEVAKLIDGDTVDYCPKHAAEHARPKQEPLF